MGADASGLVFYGFALIDDGYAAEPWEEAGGESVYRGWEERYLKVKGGLGSEPINENYRGKEWEEWRQRRDVLIGDCPVSVRRAGYDDNLISCVVIKESFSEAGWDEIKPLKTLETKPEWDSQLREWCELLDAPYLRPGWFVASLYF